MLGYSKNGKVLFCDIDELELDDNARKFPHGDYIYTRCPQCGGPSWFDMAKRMGRCFECDMIHRFHTRYRSLSDDEIYKQLGCEHLLRKRYHQAATLPEPLNPQPLSQLGRSYLYSRGISQQTLANFPMIEETHYLNRDWLCWLNV